MCQEILSILKGRSKIKTVVDLTFGAGGHSNLFFHNGYEVLALDRDKNSLNFKNPNIPIYNDKFSNFDLYAKDYDLIFADFGMSTMQLEGEKGFSFMKDSLLDMRMDSNTIPLYEIINKLNILEIEQILLGEIKQYKKVAESICRYRLKKRILTSFDLRESIGSNNFKLLAKVFQSFRIFINNEIEEIKIMLNKITPKCGAMFITFHSLEDKLIKDFCRQKTNNFLFYPSEIEITNNSKSRSAKLRGFFY